MRTRRARRGNLILLATVLCLMILMAVFSLSYMTSSDATISGHLVHELQATALAESLAVTIEARVNSGPWMKRFWLTESAAANPQAPDGPGVLPLLTFTQASGLFPTVGEGLEGLEWGYTGVVKDTDPDSHSYRIYVEVTLAGERHTFSWDKRYDESLMGAVNRDATVMDKRLEQDAPVDAPTANDPADQLIESIKTKSKEPQPDSQEDRFKGILTKLEGDQQTFEGAATVASEPAAAPELPELPVYTGTPGKKAAKRR